jgi:CubicO group peptidase (beta-lactamase class C family)
MCRTIVIWFAGFATLLNPPNHGKEISLATHPRVQSNIALLEAWIEAQMAYKGLPGMSIAIVHDQEIVYTRGFGYADIATRTPASPNTLYRIASHSKLFTAIAVMQLRDSGKLKLDDPIDKHLPWFKIKNLDPNSPPVTIRRLLTHSSGLPREAGHGYWANFEFPGLNDIKSRLPNENAVYPTEERWKYSNLGLVLVGEIIAEVTGQSLSTNLEANVFKPLGMTATTVEVPTEHRERLATAYGRRLPDGSRVTLPFIDSRGLAAAAGVASSVEDMARFISWQFRLRDSTNKEILLPGTLREMQRIQWLDAEWKSGWGLGFNILRDGDQTRVGHGGAFPGYLTATYICPDEKIGVVAFSNSLDAQPYPGQTFSLVDRAFDWVGSAITEAIKEGPAEELQERWNRLEGTYRSHWADMHVLELDGKLVLIDPTLPDPKETAGKLEPVGNTNLQFRLVEGRGYSPLGEPVIFKLGTDSKRAQSLEYNGIPFVRVELAPTAQ